MIQRQILEKIKEYDRIMLFRHVRADGDCIGATKGLKRLIELSFPEKQALIIDDEHSGQMAFLGPDDADVPEEMYREALGIVIDVGDTARISNQEFRLCKELIKIDHHIEREPYGDISWVEDWRSSACEMIAALYEACKDELKIDAQAATCIYAGMVTDSGRFRYEGVTGGTMRLAGLMLDQGVDTERLYAHLYLRDLASLRFQAYVFANMQLSEHGVASVYIDRAAQQEFGLTFEEASTAVGYLDKIKGCLCWLAFIETGDEKQSIRVRLRSRFMAINPLAEQYRGGGHANASGATVYGAEEVRALTETADAMVKEYKETHEGWL